MANSYYEVQYEDGDSYKGQWSGEGRRNGLGVLTFADKSEYAGEFIDGMNSGYGVLTFGDQSMYQGQFADGKYEGHGVFTKADKTKYEGEFKHGKVDGHGKITFPDGSSGRPRQEGTFKDRKLVTGGIQKTAVNQAREAQTAAEAKATQARALK